MNARQITAGIARPIGLFGVLVTALAVGTCRTNKSNNNNQITQQNEPAHEVPLESSNTVTGLTPPIVVASVLVENTLGANLNEIEEVTPTSQIQGLTEEELLAADFIVDFLKKYTGNGVYDYGSIWRFIEGLKYDYDTVHKDAELLTNEKEKKEGLAYPDSSMLAKFVIQQKITTRGKARITKFLEDMGVDLETSKNVDRSEIKNRVTKPELEEFGRCARLIKPKLEKDSLLGSENPFKDGISLSIIERFRNHNLRLAQKVENK